MVLVWLEREVTLLVDCTQGLAGGHQLHHGTKAKLLSLTYQAIVNSFSLTNKSRYRYAPTPRLVFSFLANFLHSEKFGTLRDDLYVCYPDGSMSLPYGETIMRSADCNPLCFLLTSVHSPCTSRTGQLIRISRTPCALDKEFKIARLPKQAAT